VRSATREKILDALVAEGANQINGPTLTIDKPEAALDEARVNAIANGRARADLYARALGKRVVRLVSVSEGGGNYPVPPPMPMVERMSAQAADTKIVAGEQKAAGYRLNGVRAAIGNEKGRPGDRAAFIVQYEPI